jgi:DNA-binding GntR family transcriptional regulator
MAYRYIRAKLTSGELVPGSRLSDLKLAREIGISRTPVREVVNQLASEGFVELVPHAGAFVRCPDEDEVRELYELREILESHAAATVARARDPEVIAALRELHAGLAKLRGAVRRSGAAMLTEKQTARQRELDLAMHETIIRAAGNRRLVKIVEDSRILGRVFDLMERRMDAATLVKTCAFHGRIIEAIAAGDARAARTEMANHIERGLKGRLARLEAWRSSGPGAKVPEALRRFVSE